MSGMSDASELEEFYNELTEFTENTSKLVSPVARTVALFRVAVEYGAVQMGLPMLAYLMSRLLTITLGLATGDEEANYDDILEEFDTDGVIKH